MEAHLNRAKTQYEGGYYLIGDDLIRSGIHGHTRELEYPVSDETLQALNAVQSTPWRINKWMLEIITTAYLDNTNIGDLPYVDLIPIPRRNDEEWEALPETEKSAWKKELSDIHGINARMEARRHSFLHKLDIANEMKDYPAIWFPHFLDFRGRFYPMPQDLHPQADDIGKSMLEFADGKPLGDRGFFWLCVRLANTYGFDKVCLDERFQWALDHGEEIRDSYYNPLDGRRFWADADDPWSFLATCVEWVESGGNADYVSHLPINVDASCNGLQHLSALARDEVGARATNVANNMVRQDIYTEVAKRVSTLVSVDAVNGVEEAHQWVGRVERKTVKRAVMTTPYGVTRNGMADQLVNDGFTRGMDRPARCANYLRDQIEKALEYTVVSARSIMGWVQEVAGLLAERDIPFRFTTPTGNVIQQSYYTLAQTRIYTLLGKLAVWEEDRFNGLNKRKQMLAAAPNLIHAFDASHMTRTINEMVRRTRDDVSFSMIHDSYGTHACDMDTLSVVLREEFVRIYKDDWLEKIEDEVREYAPDVRIPSYLERVPIGDFDVTEALRSEYFFA